MQTRRHKDILAFKKSPTSPAIALHARLLEIAEISDQSWESMAPTTLTNSFETFLTPGEVTDNSAYQELESWNTQVETSAHALKNPSVKRKPQSLTINVTQICNLHCHYCAAGGDGTYGDPISKISVEKTLPQIKYFIEQANSGESFSITFLGGEPLLYPMGIDLIGNYAKELASNKNIQIEFNIITNGTLINRENLKILQNLKANVTISLDGPPEVHDKARPQKNGEKSSFAAFNGLKLLSENKSQLGRILIHSVFTKQNLNLVDAYICFNEYNADAYEFTFDVTETDSFANQTFMEQSSLVAQKAYAKGGETELRKFVHFDRYFQAFDSQMGTKNHCGSGKTLFSIDANNKVFSCPLDVGHNDEQVGAGTEINSNLLKKYAPDLIEQNNCQTCWARFLCGGGCMFAHKAATGNKHKKHTTYCERTRYLLTIALEYYCASRIPKDLI